MKLSEKVVECPDCKVKLNPTYNIDENGECSDGFTCPKCRCEFDESGEEQ